MCTAVVDDRAITYADVGDLSHDVAVQLGRTLGMSPVAYLGSPTGFPTLDPVDQLAPLVDAAALLGYEGVEAHELLGSLTAPVTAPLTSPSARPSTGYTLVTLVPDPTSHKAAPPGRSWFCHTEPFEPSAAGSLPGAERSEVLRVVVAAERRNETSPVSSVLLWDDPIAELTCRGAVGAGADAAVVLNTSGRVVGLDVGNLVLTTLDHEGSSAAVTPPLGDGAIDTVWRRVLVDSGQVVERSLEPGDLVDADRIDCLYPWGDRIHVELA